MLAVLHHAISLPYLLSHVTSTVHPFHEHVDGHFLSLVIYDWRVHYQKEPEQMMVEQQILTSALGLVNPWPDLAVVGEFFLILLVKCHVYMCPGSKGMTVNMVRDAFCTTLASSHTGLRKW